MDPTSVSILRLTVKNSRFSLIPLPRFENVGSTLNLAAGLSGLFIDKAVIISLVSRSQESI